MWSSTCQQKEEKHMPTYTQGTVTPARQVAKGQGRARCVGRDPGQGWLGTRGARQQQGPHVLLKIGSRGKGRGEEKPGVGPEGHNPAPAAASGSKAAPAI
jgi:hypothetical protein